MDIVELTHEIAKGLWDDDLDEIREAVKARRDDIGRATQARQYADLTVGDRVIVNQDAPLRPRYLLGATGEIVEKRITKVTIRFDDDIHDPYRKWAGKRAVVDPRHLTIITGESEPEDGAKIVEFPVG